MEHVEELDDYGYQKHRGFCAKMNLKNQIIPVLDRFVESLLQGFTGGSQRW
jgi:hypothetical protein